MHVCIYTHTHIYIYIYIYIFIFNEDFLVSASHQPLRLIVRPVSSTYSFWKSRETQYL